MSLSPRYLATNRSKAVILLQFLFVFYGVSVSCCIVYSSVGYLYASGNEPITSVGEKRANLSAFVYL